MAQYGRSEYWDERYTRDPEPFDWYQRWAGLKDVVQEYVKPDCKILNVGAGNSKLTEEMYEEGYQNIVNVDISSVVIKQMEERYQDKPGMVYQQADCRALEFSDGMFDVVIDKGTLDSILCGEGSSQNAQKMLSEISRVLNPSKGVYICISHGQQSYRLTYLQKPDFQWSVKVHTVAKPMMGMTSAIGGDEKDDVHYIYVCTKDDVKPNDEE
ncbi:hypothetical protein FOZ60_002350 [Perkinsus olseni]|uniref:Methyltransferase type 11 domain-containing protein n=1 Tax=Perkinsus olseni TaxID=32597 RepID=A0A7J6PKM0_PEROL|nr:hypothetical protein FOZ60_002350 [Perkinsus olseni]